MANLPVVAQWDDVYLIETTDPVQGGLNGIDNIPHKNLANRSAFLSQAQADHAVDPNSHGGAQAGANLYKYSILGGI